MPSHLLRHLGPVVDSEATHYLQHLYRDPSSGHLLLQLDEQSIPLPGVGTSMWYKSLEVRHDTGAATKKEAIDAWNSSQRSYGRSMAEAFDAAAWTARARSTSSADERTVRNIPYGYSNNVLSQRLEVYCLYRQLPATVTGLSKVTEVSLKAKPYLTNPSANDPSGAAIRFAVDVRDSSSPLETASQIEGLRYADLDMSQSSAWRDIRISGSWDAAGDKWLQVYIFVEGFNPPKLNATSFSTGTICQCCADLARSTHFAYGGFRVTAKMEA